MANQILRYKDVVSFTAVEMTVLFSAFPTEDQSQSMPTFSKAPFINVLTSNSDRPVIVKAVTTTSVTFVVLSEGSDSLSDIELDVEIISRESDSVTGPTPSTDFSSFVPEPISTPLSILIAHGNFDPDEFPYDRILRYCQGSRRLMDELSRYYSTESMFKTTPWATPVYPDPLYKNGAYVQDDDPPSKAFDPKNRTRCLGVQVGSGAFSDMYTITFTSGTEFSCEALIQGSMGTGNTSSSFTTGNGDVVIVSDAWPDTYRDGLRFHFEVSPWYRLVHEIGLALALGELMLRAYGEESADENKVGGRLLMWANGKIKALNNPYGKGSSMRLPSKGGRDIKHHVLPYEVDFAGRNITKVSSDNQDDYGNYGEEVDVFRYLIDNDL